jgi:hypothetical protein
MGEVQLQQETRLLLSLVNSHHAHLLLTKLLARLVTLTALRLLGGRSAPKSGFAECPPTSHPYVGHTTLSNIRNNARLVRVNFTQL